MPNFDQSNEETQKKYVANLAAQRQLEHDGEVVPLSMANIIVSAYPQENGLTAQTAHFDIYYGTSSSTVSTSINLTTSSGILQKWLGAACVSAGKMAGEITHFGTPLFESPPSNPQAASDWLNQIYGQLLSSVPALEPPLQKQLKVRKSLAQLFAESPFKGLDLEFDRKSDTGRNVEL